MIADRLEGEKKTQLTVPSSPVEAMPDSPFERESDEYVLSSNGCLSEDVKVCTAKTYIVFMCMNMQALLHAD